MGDLGVGRAGVGVRAADDGCADDGDGERRGGYGGRLRRVVELAVLAVGVCRGPGGKRKCYYSGNM